LESLALTQGVVAATIAVINGRIKVGLTQKDLETLATSKSVLKLSKKDIPYALATHSHGSTTVAATMYIAHLAGIKVFATGGIGGVHRFVTDSYDISGDLNEFANTPVIVVSAGAKVILDLPKTLEYLETQGVPVYGYKTNEFPSFYYNETELTIDRVNDAKEVAMIYRIAREMNMRNGMLLANPIPKAYCLEKSVIDPIIDKCINEAIEKKIVGKAVTPYLLSRIYEYSKGASLDTNIELVKNNVLVGCEVMKEMCK